MESATTQRRAVDRSRSRNPAMLRRPQTRIGHQRIRALDRIVHQYGPSAARRHAGEPPGSPDRHQAVRAGAAAAATGQFRCDAAHLPGGRAAIHDGSARRVRRNVGLHECTAITESWPPRSRAIRSFAGHTPTSACRSGWPTAGPARRSGVMPADESGATSPSRSNRSRRRPSSNAAEIERELQTAALRGYADSKGQRTVGIYAVAAPVFDHTQKVAGRLGRRSPRSG